MYRAITKDPATSIWVWARTVDKTKAIARAITLSCHVDVLPYQVLETKIPQGSTHRIEVDYPPTKENLSIDVVPLTNNMNPLVSEGDLSRVSSRLQIAEVDRKIISNLPITKMEYRDLVEIVLNLKNNKECRGAGAGAIECRDLPKSNDPSAWRLSNNPDNLVEALVADMKLHLLYRQENSKGDVKLKEYTKPMLMEYINTFFQSCQIDSTKEYLLSLDPNHEEWSVPESDLLVYRYWSEIFEGNSWPDELKDQMIMKYTEGVEDMVSKTEEIEKEVEKYIRYVSALTPLTMVLRTLYPGCTVKESMLLCGKQGAGKSELYKHMLPPHLQDSKFRPGVNELLSTDKKFYLWRNASLVEYADTVFSGPNAAVQISAVKAERRTPMFTIRVAYGKTESTYPVKCAFFRTCNPVEGVTGSDHSGTDDTLFLRTYELCPEEQYNYFYRNNEDNRTRLWIGAMRLARKVVEEVYASGHEKVSLKVPESIKRVGRVAIANFVPDKEVDIRDESEASTKIDKDMRGMIRDLDVYSVGRLPKHKKFAFLFDDVLEHSMPLLFAQFNKIDHRNKDIQKFKSALRTIGFQTQNYQRTPNEYYHICIITKELIMEHGLSKLLDKKQKLKLGQTELEEPLDKEIPL